jgi:hypothetical protein
MQAIGYRPPNEPRCTFVEEIKLLKSCLSVGLPFVEEVAINGKAELTIIGVSKASNYPHDTFPIC